VLQYFLHFNILNYYLEYIMASFVSSILASSAPELLAATPWWVKVAGSAFTSYTGINLDERGQTYTNYAKEFRENPDCQAFFAQNAEKFEKIKQTVKTCSNADTKALDILHTLAKSNSDNLAIKGCGLRCLGQIVKSLPLIAFTVQTSSVIGLLGTGVVTVVVLTPIVAKLIEFSAEILHCKDSTKKSIHKLTDKMMFIDNYRVTMTLPAMLFANTFSQNGLQSGLVWSVPVWAICLSIEYFIFVARNKTAPAFIDQINKKRKTPPSDEELKQAEAIDKEICKDYYEAEEKLKTANVELRAKKGTESTIRYLCEWKLNDVFEYTQKSNEDSSSTDLWTRSGVDQESFTKQSEDQLANGKKLLDLAKQDLDDAQRVHDEAHKELQRISAEINFPSKHRNYLNVKKKYDAAVQVYKYRAPTEYKGAVATLRAVNTSTDELQWLQTYLELVMVIEEVGDLQRNNIKTPSEQDQSQAKSKIEELNTKIDAKRNQLFVGEDDCMEKHLTLATINWLKAYERHAMDKLDSYKKDHKLENTNSPESLISPW